MTKQSMTLELLKNLRNYLRHWPARHHFGVKGSAIRSIFDVMLSFFEEDGWPLIRGVEKSVLYTTFQGDSGRWLCLAEAHDEDRRFVFYSICPQMVSEEQREAIAFLEHQLVDYKQEGRTDARLLALGDFCQVLVSLNEFVFLD